MKNLKINKYLLEELYLILLGALAFVSWAYEYEILVLTAMILISIFIIFVVKKSIYIWAIFPFTLIMIGNGLDKLVLVGLISLEILIIFIADFLQNGNKKLSLGKLGIPILIMIATMLLSLINTPVMNDSIIGISHFVVLILIYLYFRNVSKGTDKEKLFMSKLMTFFGLAIIAELAFYLYQSGDIANTIVTKQIDLGWAISNLIATILVFIIPFTMYYAQQLKFKMLVLLFALIEVSGLIATVSRGGYISFAIILIPLLLIAVLKDKNKLNMAIQGALTLSAFLPLVYWLYINGHLHAFKVRMFQADLFYISDRIPVFEKAIEVFNTNISHMIIGGGVFSSHFYLDYNLHYFHNMFLQALATTGIIGLIALLYFLATNFLVVFKNESYHLFVLLALIAGFIQGMADTSFYNPIYMFIIMPPIILCEFGYDNLLEGIINPFKNIKLKKKAKVNPHKLAMKEVK